MRLSVAFIIVSLLSIPTIQDSEEVRYREI